MGSNSAVAASDIDTERLVADLRAWVEIETPTPEAALVNALVDLVEQRSRAAGFTIERTPGTLGLGDILTVSSRADPGRNGSGILVLAHLDTVHPVGTLAGDLPWREVDGKIYGPGVCDMKAGALIALHALEIAARRPDRPSLPVTIMFVPDEETGSVSSRAAIEAAGRSAKYALVVEPARDGGKIVIARKGVAMYDVVIRGRPSHAGAKPEEGRSAIREAAKQILALEALNDRERGITVTVGLVSGGSARNVVPAECRLGVDVRVPDAATAEEILPRIEGLVSSDPDIRIEVTGGLNRPAFTQTDDAKSLFDHAAGLAAPLGIDLVGIHTGGGSDGNFTAALGVPTLDGLGADGVGAHTMDEHIFADSLAPRTALLANLYLTLR